MEKEKFKRACEIERSVFNLEDEKKQIENKKEELNNEKEGTIHLRLTNSRMGSGIEITGYLDIEDIVDSIIRKIDKKIKALQKEFDSL